MFISYLGKLLVFATAVPYNSNLTDIMNPSSVDVTRYTRLSWMLRDRNTNEILTYQPIALQLLIGRTMFHKYGEEVARTVCKLITHGQTVQVIGQFSAVDLTDESLMERLKSRNSNATLDFIVHDYNIISNATSVIKSVCTDIMKPQKARYVKPLKLLSEKFIDEIGIESKKEYHRLNIRSSYNFNVKFSSNENIISNEIEIGELTAGESIIETNPKLIADVFLINDLISITKFTETIVEINNELLLNNQNILMIGIDCEWKPENGLPNPVAILQIAVNENVFLIDLLTICNHNETIENNSFLLIESLNEAFNLLFHYKITENIQKIIIGFNLSADLRKLVNSYPFITSFHKYQTILDLSSLSLQINTLISHTNVNTKKHGRSLSKLSNEILGKYLNKSQQCSPWHIRPLTIEQIEYAALDSLILLKIFQQLSINYQTSTKFYFNKLVSQLFRIFKISSHINVDFRFKVQ